MKKYKGLILLSALLVVLLAVYIGITLSGSLDTPEDTDSDTDTELYSVPSIDISSLVGISYTYLGETYSFNLSDDQTLWLWDGNTSLILDNENFAYMSNAFSELTSSIKLEGATESDLDGYGLNTPTAVIKFIDGNGTHTFNVGIKNTYNGLYYLNEAASPSDVYMVDGDILEYFKYTPDGMLKHDILPTPDISDVVSVTVEKDGTTLVYTPVTENIAESETETADTETSDTVTRWYLSVGEEKLYVGDELSGGLTQAVTEAEFKDFITYDPETLSEYGLDTPTRITVAYKENTDDSSSTDESTVVILLGGASDNGLFYAKLESSPYTYTISPAIFGNLLDAESE